MRKINFIIFFALILINNLFFLDLQSAIKNKIIVKVGETLITSLDIRNEIITSLVLNRQELNQENIDKRKNLSVQNLISKSIKKNEISKYKIEKFNMDDLQKYISEVSNKFNTDQNGLKKIFKDANIDYDTFLENHKTELLWNTLIFQIYRNQINVNIIEVDNELEKIKESKNKEELKKIRENILSNKKSEKLSLFSRSHFSNLENTVNISFQ
tara:strand:- start:292 stop:930 length:639 start_codon:yes stop_codon:yes gene_type:complete